MTTNFINSLGKTETNKSNKNGVREIERIQHSRQTVRGERRLGQNLGKEVTKCVSVKFRGGFILLFT